MIKTKVFLEGGMCMPENVPYMECEFQVLPQIGSYIYLSDDDLKEITNNAINYFNSLDKDYISKEYYSDYFYGKSSNKPAMEWDIKDFDLSDVDRVTDIHYLLNGEIHIYIGK